MCLYSLCQHFRKLVRSVWELHRSEVTGVSCNALLIRWMKTWVCSNFSSCFLSISGSRLLYLRTDFDDFETWLGSFGIFWVCGCVNTQTLRVKTCTAGTVNHTSSKRRRNNRENHRLFIPSNDKKYAFFHATVVMECAIFWCHSPNILCFQNPSSTVCCERQPSPVAEAYCRSVHWHARRTPEWPRRRSSHKTNIYTFRYSASLVSANLPGRARW